MGDGQPLPSWTSRKYTPVRPKPVLSGLNTALVSLGAAMVVATIAFIGRETAVHAFYRPIPPQQQTTRLIPVRMAVPEAHVDIPLTATDTVHGIWPIPTGAAGYVRQSATIGGRGNIIVYGTSQRDTLGALRSARSDTEIRLYDQYGTVHRYRLAVTDTIPAGEPKYVQPEPTEILTVMVLEGMLDSTRYIVRAIPAESVTSGTSHAGIKSTASVPGVTGPVLTGVLPCATPASLSLRLLPGITPRASTGTLSCMAPRRIAGNAIITPMPLAFFRL